MAERRQGWFRIAGTMLTDGSYTVSADDVAKLRATLQGDDQRLFDPDVLKLDGWTLLKDKKGKLCWTGPKASPPQPQPQDLPASASADEQAWAVYLADMADPKKWAERQRRRAFLLGSHFSEWIRKQDPVALAKRGPVPTTKGCSSRSSRKTTVGRSIDQARI